MAVNDCYKLLNISDRCTLAELKRAFRAKAKIYHPDVNKNANAEEVFKALNKAYETLYPIVEKRAPPPKKGPDNPGLMQETHYFMKSDMAWKGGYKVFDKVIDKASFIHGLYVKCFIAAGLVNEKEVLAKLIIRPGSTAPVSFELGKVKITFHELKDGSMNYEER